MTDIPDEIEEFAEFIYGGYWNYRFIKIVVPYDELDDNLNKTGKTRYETYYELHEVYYDKTNKIWSWSEEPVKVTPNDGEDLLEFIRCTLDASMKKVLTEKDGNMIQLDEYMDKKEILEMLRKDDDDGQTN